LSVKDNQSGPVIELPSDQPSMDIVRLGG